MEDFIFGAAELCTKGLIPILITFTLIYYCGYTRYRLIYYKNLNRHIDALIRAIASTNLDTLLNKKEKDENKKVVNFNTTKENTTDE